MGSDNHTIITGSPLLGGIFMMFAAVFAVIAGTVILLGRESKQQTLEELEHALGEM